MTAKKAQGSPPRAAAGITAVVDMRERVQAGPSLEMTGVFSREELGLDLRPTDPAIELPYIEPKAVRVEREGTEPLVVPLYPDRTYVFGRAPESTFVFPCDAVSRLHGQLHFRQDLRWVYRDLSSRNGSFALKEMPPKERDPRGSATPIASGRDRVVHAGDIILLGNRDSRVVLLEEVPKNALLHATPASSASPATARLERAIEVCARHRLPVFLLGPYGSGKTFVARSIHERSRMVGHFVLINCGRLPQDPAQLTSELLGHVRGGFTGAIAARMGKFQSAHDGTLFLDEVESLPPIAQDFLLDVLDGSGNFAPLGAPADLHVPAPRFRLIAASKQALSATALRPDLTQRLAGDMIVLPTLNERREDIPQLVQAFLGQLQVEQQISAELSPDAIRYLQRADWPGQIRELESTVKVVVSREHALKDIEGARSERIIVSLEAVKAYLVERRSGFGAGTGQAGPESPPPGEAQRKRPADLTSDDIREALRRCDGNKTHAAQLLGVAVNTLKAKMRAFGIVER